MAIPKQGPVIAIDGPAGTGKSTATRRLCEALGFVHVDTGALYRSIALVCLEKKILKPGEEEACVKLAREAHIEFKYQKGAQPPNRVFLNGKDVSAEIRTEAVSMGASRVSAIPGVRASLLGLQRKLGCVGRAILEGRDIGTIIFPDADVKFFLTASAATRAQRRLGDLKAAGGPVPSLEEIQKQIEQRDKDDSSRKIAPLKKAADAVEIDTSSLTLDEVVSEMEKLAREKLKL